MILRSCLTIINNANRNEFSLLTQVKVDKLGTQTFSFQILIELQESAYSSTVGCLDRYVILYT